MTIFNITFDNWETISIEFNWVVVLICFVLLIFILLLKLFKQHLSKKTININEVTLGIGNSSVSISCNQKSREIAYKLWVELSTRKIGIPFDEKNDVVIEIYNSWYEFFKIARELMKEIPANQINCSSELIDLTERVLNNGLRPHLTLWQARFRKWYDYQSKNSKCIPPQKIQTEYKEYETLIKDLKATNAKMIEYKELMRKIAFEK